MQRIVVIPNRRFRTTYRSPLQESRSVEDPPDAKTQRPLARDKLMDPPHPPHPGQPPGG